MLNNFHIHNFKCLEKEDFEFGKLNIITGLNSTGKSSVIQAILYFSDWIFSDWIYEKGSSVSYAFDDLRNKYNNSREINLKIDTLEKPINIFMEENKIHIKYSESEDINIIVPRKNENLFYLAEDRIGPLELEINKQSNSIGLIHGDKGELVFSNYESLKSNPIDKNLVIGESSTLYQNVDYWLKKVLDVDVSLLSKEVTSEKIKISYDFDELEGISPKNLGAGVSYLSKILIICLLAKPNDTIIIENPEIHLHPKAQSKLGEFFAFIASKEIQLILETHSEHLINRVRYEVYKEKLESEEVKLFYKETNRSPFIKLVLDNNGHYLGENSERMNFPSGFFDSTLDELLEIG